jgi:DNA-binding IclR family transcriptional regulator
VTYSDLAAVNTGVDFDDEYARAILAHLTIEPMSVDELCTACEMSDATAYRRLDRLQDADLVTEQQELDPDGHHYKQYTATVETVSVTSTSYFFLTACAAFDVRSPLACSGVVSARDSA